MIPGIHPEEAWEDQELRPGNAHSQEQNLDEDQAGMPPARCEDLTGDYACHECCQDEIEEPKLPENLGASLHQFYDKSLFSRKCPCNTIRIEMSNELQRLKMYRHIIP